MLDGKTKHRVLESCWCGPGERARETRPSLCGLWPLNICLRIQGHSASGRNLKVVKYERVRVLESFAGHKRFPITSSADGFQSLRCGCYATNTRWKMEEQTCVASTCWIVLGTRMAEAQGTGAEAWHSDKLLGLTYLHPQPLSLQSKLQPGAI